MNIACNALVPIPYRPSYFVGVVCNKDRGVILPGGKFEGHKGWRFVDGGWRRDVAGDPREGETFRESAVRELKEETQVDPDRSKDQPLIFGGMNYDGFYVYTFLIDKNPAQDLSMLIGTDWGSGVVRIAHRDDFMRSYYKAYYELMFEAYYEHLRREEILRDAEYRSTAEREAGE